MYKLLCDVVSDLHSIAYVSAKLHWPLSISHLAF